LPRGLTTADGSAISHGILTLVMWGRSAGFWQPGAKVILQTSQDASPSTRKNP
jgi:hypothetical protein